MKKITLQPKTDSNHRLQGQSLPCYHYTKWLPLKTAYLHRLAVDLFTFKFFNYEKFSIPTKWFNTINNMSNVCGRGRIQTCNSCAFTRFYQLNYPTLKIHLFSRTDVFFLKYNYLLFIYYLNMENLAGHRTDSNHRTPSVFQPTKLRCPICCCQLCALPHI